MLWTILGILILLWLVGVVSNVVGGVIHLLLVLAVLVVAYRFLSGRRAA
jgi:hypothetical protein